MISEQTRAKLKDIGRQVKTLMPQYDGQVSFNLDKRFSDPKINVLQADVTSVKDRK